MPVSQAVILAGGAGTRLRPLVSDVPKPLAPVCGRPFIEYLLAQVAAAGIGRAVLLAGHMSDRLVSQLGNEVCGVALEYSVESEPLGTAGALKLAESLLDGDSWLLLNGDSMFDISLAELIAAHERAPAPVTMALAAVADASRYGGVVVDSAGAVRSFNEKSAAGSAPRLINAGLYVITADVIDAVPPGRPVSFEREILPGLVGGGLTGIEFGGYFIDIGVPDDYRRAQRDCDIFERLITAVPRQ